MMVVRPHEVDIPTTDEKKEIDSVIKKLDESILKAFRGYVYGDVVRINIDNLISSDLILRRVIDAYQEAGWKVWTEMHLNEKYLVLKR